MLLTVFEIVAFFTRLYSEEKSAAISKLTYIWTTSSPSYIFLALEWNALTLKCCDVEMLIVEMLWLRTDLLVFLLWFWNFKKTKNRAVVCQVCHFFHLSLYCIKLPVWMYDLYTLSIFSFFSAQVAVFFQKKPQICKKEACFIHASIHIQYSA